jgi:histone H3/H4
MPRLKSPPKRSPHKQLFNVSDSPPKYVSISVEPKRKGKGKVKKQAKPLLSHQPVDGVFNSFCGHPNPEISQSQSQPVTYYPASSSNEGAMSLNFQTIPKKPKHPQSESVLMQIRRLQTTTQLIFPKRAFARLIREVADEVGQSGQGFRWSAVALMALQEASEHFLVRVLEDAQLEALHAKRITVTNKDIELVMKIRDFGSRC